jgi:DsbC/DsbD-like thiol-disulfide interchange protein
MIDWNGRVRVAGALVLGLVSVAALGQSGAQARSNPKAAAVEFLFPEQITIPAGRTTTVALHFRIAQGMHINSHTPREEELIPTTLSIPEASGVRLDGAAYPPGTEFTLPLEPKEKLSVYTGEFTIQARMMAASGDHLVEAKLRYQACDNNACMPPRTITVPIDVLGK